MPFSSGKSWQRCKGYARDLRHIGGDALSEYRQDRCELMAAATAFYVLLSLAPLLLLLLAIASWFVGEPAAQRGLIEQAARAAGPSSAIVVERLLRDSEYWQSGTGFGLLSLSVSLYGATRLFVQLQSALNHVWKVRVAPSVGLKANWWWLTQRRAFSYLLVLGVGLLFTASLGASAWLNALSGPLIHLVPLHWLWRLFDPALSFAVGTVVFGLLFKVVPDAAVRWRDVWVGAVVTSLLFLFGKSVLAWYLGYRALPLTDGLAAPLVVLILWAHYSARVFFVGAELTQVWARFHGAVIVSSSRARDPLDSKATGRQIH